MVDEQTKPAAESPDAPDVTEVVKKWYWISDSKGYGSVTVTFATVAFWVTTFAYIASIFDSVGPIKFRQFDVAACAAYLTPTLTLYFGRRWTDAKFSST